jgi:hypothetical protein
MAAVRSRVTTVGAVVSGEERVRLLGIRAAS